MSNNTLMIAAAGAGKTTYIVKKASTINKNILILTYTLSNKEVIKRRFYLTNGCIPKNVTIQTWFSFLIQHGVKPYQGSIDDSLFDFDIRGMILVNEQSGFRYKYKGRPVYWKEENIKKFYFTKDNKLYSDKISKFVCRCNEKSNGAVLDRLAQIYDHIYIDEVQDLAGYDLELLRKLLASPITVLLVGDPRQVTYLTHHERKYAKYRNGRILEFIDNELGRNISYEADTTTLNASFRCIQHICEYSSKLYPDLPETQSSSLSDSYDADHQGVFLVKSECIEEYQKQYSAMQLRWDRKTEVHPKYQVINFGKAKGETFDRVLIYPTGDIAKWIKNHTAKLSDGARAKFYVALTRARYSAAIVMDFNEDKNYPGIIMWQSLDHIS